MFVNKFKMALAEPSTNREESARGVSLQRSLSYLLCCFFVFEEKTTCLFHGVHADTVDCTGMDPVLS